MPPLAIYADRALTPLEEIPDAVIVVEGRKIAALGRRGELRLPAGIEERDARGLTVVPGFVDIHIHGAGGHDVMEGSTEALETVAATVARRGTTSLVATTVTASEERLVRSVEGIAQYVATQQNPPSSAAPKAEVLGIHLEGPFISMARRGVHPPEWIALPSVPALRRYLQAAGNYARILTLAPEQPGALDLIEVARAAGLLVAMGHTDATYAEACAAIAKGARHVVHVFNAMRPFSHRETGVLGAVLTSPEVTAELIADGVHVDAPAVRLLLAVKGVARVLLVTDGIAATGMPDGRYRLGTFEVGVIGGVCRSADGRLAGSTLTLDRALRNVIDLGMSLADAVRMATLNPARRLGLEQTKGVLTPGADADLVLLNPDLQVVGVLTRGVGFLPV